VYTSKEFAAIIMHVTAAVGFSDVEECGRKLCGCLPEMKTQPKETRHPHNLHYRIQIIVVLLSFPNFSITLTELLVISVRERINKVYSEFHKKTLLFRRPIYGAVGYDICLKNGLQVVKFTHKKKPIFKATTEL
jgi:hypothetical protein